MNMRGVGMILNALLESIDRRGSDISKDHPKAAEGKPADGKLICFHRLEGHRIRKARACLINRREPRGGSILGGSRSLNQAWCWFTLETVRIICRRLGIRRWTRNRRCSRGSPSG